MAHSAAGDATPSGGDAAQLTECEAGLADTRQDLERCKHGRANGVDLGTARKTGGSGESC